MGVTSCPFLLWDTQLAHVTFSHGTQSSHNQNTCSFACFAHSRAHFRSIKPELSGLCPNRIAAPLAVLLNSLDCEVQNSMPGSQVWPKYPQHQPGPGVLRRKFLVPLHPYWKEKLRVRRGRVSYRTFWWFCCTLRGESHTLTPCDKVSLPSYYSYNIVNN